VILTGTVLVVAAAAGVTAGCGRADDSTSPPGSYTVRDSGVAMRTGGDACMAAPGPGTCPQVLLGLDPGQRLEPICQRHGQTMGRNPYWVFASGPRGNRGWVPSWFVDYPTNHLPGVVECTADHLRSPRWSASRTVR